MNQVYEYDINILGFGIIDPKGSQWLGLEDCKEEDGSPVVVRITEDDIYSIEKAIEKLEWVIELKKKRKKIRERDKKLGKYVKPAPYYFLIDEWIINLILAEMYDEVQKEEYESLSYDDKKEEPKPQSIKKKMIRLVKNLLVSAREDQIFLWIYAQSPLVEDIELSGGLRDQVYFLSQGGDGNYGSVEKALSNSSLTPAGKVRKELQHKLIEMTSNNPEARIFYTNIKGRTLNFITELEDIQGRIYFRQKTVKQNEQSTTSTTGKTPTITEQRTTTIFPELSTDELF